MPLSDPPPPDRNLQWCSRSNCVGRKTQLGHGPLVSPGSSSWCVSATATATIWRSKSSCSATRLPCSVVKSCDRHRGPRIEHCSPGCADYSTSGVGAGSPRNQRPPARVAPGPGPPQVDSAPDRDGPASPPARWRSSSAWPERNPLGAPPDPGGADENGPRADNNVGNRQQYVGSAALQAAVPPAQVDSVGTQPTNQGRPTDLARSHRNTRLIQGHRSGSSTASLRHHRR